MLSYQVIENGKPLEVREADTPEPQGAEVLVKVSACGVCHSDIHLLDGFYELADGQRLTLADRGVEPPFTMGHEVVGVVEALGPEAEGVEVGDKRVVFPWIGCGECDVCQSGNENVCIEPRTIGVRRPGGYGQYVMVPDAKYLIDYEGIPTELACTYACSGLTAYSALRKTGAIGPNHDVVLIGAGGVGLSGVMFAPHVVSGKIIVADVDAAKRSLARQSGAHETVDNSEADAVAKVREMTDGGAAAAIDFVGAPATAKFGIDVLRKGGTLVSVGLYGGALPVSLALLPLMAHSIKGSYVGTLEELREVIELAKGGKISPIPVETRPLDSANEALNDLRAGSVMGRVVLKL